MKAPCNTSNISKDRLLKAIGNFKECSILVVGDVMLDQFLWGDSERISPEAPVPVVNVEKEGFSLGGAANVAHNISSLSGTVHLAGVVGNDDAGKTLVNGALERGIHWRGMIGLDRPTTLKMRVIARGQQMLRIDREKKKGLSGPEEEGLRQGISLALDQVDCIVVSDYAKGVISEGLMAFLKDAAKARSIPLLVDPKPENTRFYEGVDILTPNRKEAFLMAASTGKEPPLEDLMKGLKEELLLGSLLVTLGDKGMALLEDDTGFCYMPTQAKEVYDVTGAGDTVTATVALGRTLGLNLLEACFLANIAAGIVVAKVGTATLGIDELIQGVERAVE